MIQKNYYSNWSEAAGVVLTRNLAGGINFVSDHPAECPSGFGPWVADSFLGD